MARRGKQRAALDDLQIAADGQQSPPATGVSTREAIPEEIVTIDERLFVREQPQTVERQMAGGVLVDPRRGSGGGLARTSGRAGTDGLISQVARPMQPRIAIGRGHRGPLTGPVTLTVWIQSEIGLQVPYQDALGTPESGVDVTGSAPRRVTRSP